MDPSPQESIQALSKEDAQQAFIKYASEKCCRSSRPAEEGVITDMEAFSTYRYCLETFTEARTEKWTQRPYSGEVIETGGLPPALWEIPIDGRPFFQDRSIIIEVPNTASVQDCSICCATGNVTCMSCSGMGRNTCIGCGGRGYMCDQTMCNTCSGFGMTHCWACGGMGTTTCCNCAGRSEVVVALNLIVKWVNNIEIYTVEQASGLKMAKLGKVSGIKVFQDTNNMVYPLTAFPDQAIVQASNMLHRKHEETYSQSSRILQQRQTIELLPINKVTYEWSGESHVFFVYGTELKVSAEDYPAACCCCGRCTVM